MGYVLGCACVVPGKGSELLLFFGAQSYPQIQVSFRRLWGNTLSCGGECRVRVWIVAWLLRVPLAEILGLGVAKVLLWLAVVLLGLAELIIACKLRVGSILVGILRLLRVRLRSEGLRGLDERLLSLHKGLLRLDERLLRLDEWLLWLYKGLLRLPISIKGLLRNSLWLLDYWLLYLNRLGLDRLHRRNWSSVKGKR